MSDMEDYKKKYEELVENFDTILNLNTVRESGVISVDDVRKLIPELKKSDKMIREALIDGFTVMKESKNCGKTFSKYNIHVDDILAWLEKQKSTQTPQWMIDFLDDYRRHIGSVLDYDEKRDIDGKILAIYNYLKGNPNINQNIVEWNEKDKKRIEEICEDLRCGMINFKAGKVIKGLHYDEIIESNIDWLKSISPNHWKPTKEQMDALKEECINKKSTEIGAHLCELYEQLNRL